MKHDEIAGRHIRTLLRGGARHLEAAWLFRGVGGDVFIEGRGHDAV